MKPETINLIKSIEKHFDAVLSASNIRLSRDEVNTIGAIWKQLEPARRLNLGCKECVEIALVGIANKWANYLEEQQSIAELTTKEVVRKKIKK